MYHLVTKDVKMLMIPLVHSIPVPFLGLAEVGRPKEVRGEETASLGRLAAGEQIGLIVVTPLTMLHGFNSNCAHSLNMLGYREERWTGCNYGETSATH